MGIEIERKFLVCGDGWRPGPAGVAFRQGYLASGAGPTVRVRVAPGRAWICVKGPAEGIMRPEFEYEVPCAEAEAMLALCPQPPVEKTRYRRKHAGRTWEVDEFHGANAGLLVAEIELQDIAEQPDLPGWVGADVSADRRYSNAALAQRPFSQW
ncbi:MAG: CYTH domain-containing protein [Akkermansiaceae bacterium]|nr:CYTH domain-containing protein [Akkermansiaceae bacterium]